MVRKKKIVVIGGGTGTYSVLSGLKRYSDSVDITAVVAMSDNGSSTGRLRDEFGVLPVGDVRMALLALSDEECIDHHTLRSLLTYRFTKGEGLAGHNLGNLLLVALSDILGGEKDAIESLSRLLGLRGKVLPVTTDHISLVARYDDGSEVVGESSIDEPPHDRGERIIESLSVTPSAVLGEGVREAITEADCIVLGPGDLYTSLLAAVVVGDVSSCIQKARGSFVFIGNLMSKFGQTTGFDSAKYVAEIGKYVGRFPDAIYINTESLPPAALARYTAIGEHPVLDAGSGRDETRVVRGDFLAKEMIRNASGETIKRSLVRHDGAKLAALLIESESRL
jgi:uncharacterized cofD-like protein